MRTRVHEIMKKEPDDLRKLLMSLYTDSIVRRSTDYTKMLVKREVFDDKKNNILIWTPKVKKFIFNKWKESRFIGQQSALINNKNLEKVLAAHLRKHPDDKYLLERDGRAITNAQVVALMDSISTKNEIPFHVRHMRHLLASHCKFAMKFSDNEMKQLALQMGTSMQMLEKHYIDYPVIPQINVEDLALKKQVDAEMNNAEKK